MRRLEIKMFRLTILSLENGWAEIEIKGNNLCNTLCFEYTPVDGLSDMVKASLDVMNGRDGQVELYCGSNKFVIKIKSLSNSCCCFSFQEVKIDIEKIQFARAVLRMFDKYIYEHSKEEYSKAWGHYFPDKYIEHLRNNINK